MHNEYQHQYQNFTLLAAVSAGNEWTITEINKLKDLREANVSVTDIAIILGRTYYAVQTYLGANGLTKARKQTTPAPQIQACPQCWLTKCDCEM
jgi:hypothetical protein